MCLAITPGNTSDRGPVAQQPCNGSNEQLWRQTSVSGGMTYTNIASGKCLDLTLDNQPVSPGATIYQFTCHGGSNQVWKAKPQGVGSALVSAYNGLCVGIFGASTQAGTGTVGWTCTGVPDQTYLGNGGRPLVSAQSGLCLSVPAGNKDDRGPVTQQTCTGAAEQQWRPTAGNGGTAYVNVASGKCLDQSLDTQPAVPGAAVYQYTCTNATNQAWMPKPQGGGSNLVSVNSNLCLGVLGGTGQVGSGTVGWTCNGAADQIFTASSSKL
ncbi:RICIN domain-containing protein [Methylobacterium persicinum]